MSDLQAYWADTHFEDAPSMIHDTKHAMLGSLAVTMSGTVESFVGALCEDLGVKLSDRAGWGEKRQKLEACLAFSCDDLDGMTQVTRVRLLGNCYKHNGGKKDAEFTKRFGGGIGEEIEYVAEDWPALIAATHTFLLALVERTP